MKKEYKEGILSKNKCELWIADDDGDIEDDFPPCENNQIVSKLGIKKFYLKIIKPNKTISNSPISPNTPDALTTQQNGTRGSVSKTSTALLSPVQIFFSLFLFFLYLTHHNMVFDTFYTHLYLF